MKTRKCVFLSMTLFLGMLLFFCCKDEAYVHQEPDRGAPFNPSIPVKVTGFLPDSGRYAEKIVISGANFGNDKEQVKVYFSDGVSAREASVVNVSETSIYCIVPRLPDGENQLKVVVGGKSEAEASKGFHYTASEQVSWVAGVGTREGTGAFHRDGTLADAHFHKIMGIVPLGNDQFITTGSYEGAANKVRYISVPDNSVITIQDGVFLAKPAINEDRTVVYTTTLNPTHTVYEYRKDNGWMPYRIGEIPAVGSGNDRIQSLTMMDKAHDPNQEWLYFPHKTGRLMRFNVNTQVTEELGADLYPAQDWVGYILYDKFNDCFYVSHFGRYCIYKISRTGATWSDGVTSEIYAGSPSQSAVVDGTLQDARFRDPKGMCIDEEGNIYIVEQNACVVRKISAADGYVTTVAGTLNVNSPQTNGDPAEAIFLNPRDICYDGAGSFFIAEWWESTIRRYAVL